MNDDPQAAFVRPMLIGCIVRQDGHDKLHLPKGPDGKCLTMDYGAKNQPSFVPVMALDYFCDAVQERIADFDNRLFLAKYSHLDQVVRQNQACWLVPKKGTNLVTHRTLHKDGQRYRVACLIL